MRNVIASGTSGINWCWYHWLTVDDEARTVVETQAERFHRFDEKQGANDHPACDVGRFDVYLVPDNSPERIAVWGAETVARQTDDWERNLAKWGLPADTRAVAVLDGKAYVYK